LGREQLEVGKELARLMFRPKEYVPICPFLVKDTMCAGHEVFKEVYNNIYCVASGSSKANGREPKICVGRVFNLKFGCLTIIQSMGCAKTAKSRLENSAQVSSF
jgi:hypothetical protein